MKSFWRFIEGEWARNIANRVSTPSDRKVQQSIDYESLYMVCRVHESLASKGYSSITPTEPLSHIINVPALHMETKAMPFKQQKAWKSSTKPDINANSYEVKILTACFPYLQVYVDEHVREGLNFMAKTMHDTLKKAHDPTYAAMAAAAAFGERNKNGFLCSAPSQALSMIGRAGLAQLVRPHIGFSLRVGPSSVNHPHAGTLKLRQVM